MNQKIIGLLSFALGGVVLNWILMYVFDVPQGFQGGVDSVRLGVSIAVFLGFLFLGYGLMQIIKQEKQNPS
jgi:hypothetical protein